MIWSLMNYWKDTHTNINILMPYFPRKMITFHVHILFILCLLLKHQQALCLASHHNSTNFLTRSACKSTPYPDVCIESLKLSISINININIDIIIIQQSLKVALSEGVELLNMISNTNNGILEKHKGTIQDCKELHQITLSSLKKSITATKSSPFFKSKFEDTKAFLSAALTNKNTCLEGLDSASGPLKPLLVDTIISTYKHVSNSLSLVSNINLHANISTNNDDDDDDNDDYYTFTVAKDGSGNFSTITDAINFAPNNSVDRVIIYIKQGLYQENVEIPSYKPNIVLLGEGSGLTIITGNRSVVDGWTTFRSATVAVSGEGFLARDIGFYNTAGAEKHQAVALRINADFAAVYRCVISGYQDTLYVHSFRQFYRECDIYGTIDYIFGNAAVVFQGCNIISKMPMPGQFTVISAHSRDSPDQQTGISFQNCSVLATEDLHNNATNYSLVKSYLGRPWKPYSRTVFIESYIDDLIDPKGWIHWSGDDQGLDTLYYGEYGNYGPGSPVDGRVTWPGYHVMDYYDASNFTVSQLIIGYEWLDSTSFPYDDWV